MDWQPSVSTLFNNCKSACIPGGAGAASESFSLAPSFAPTYFVGPAKSRQPA
jgi:hypothetical protein